MAKFLGFALLLPCDAQGSLGVLNEVMWSGLCDSVMTGRLVRNHYVQLELGGASSASFRSVTDFLQVASV